MRRWKWLGLAGLMGVAATGAVVARRRRAAARYEPEELRERLHRRLADVVPPTGSPERAASGTNGSRA